MSNLASTLPRLEAQNHMSAKETDPSQGVTVHELARLRDANDPHVMFDVREPSELAICRLEGARHVPMHEIPHHLDAMPGDRPIVVMCHHGIRSARVVEYLRRAGFANAVNLEGGIDAWARQIDPKMAVY